ncbi:MAG: hypothetical protein U0232_24250 [Thermomicrobiales bacterium]
MNANMHDKNERIRAATFKAAVNKGFAELDRGEGKLFTLELRNQMIQNAERKARQGHKPDPNVTPVTDCRMTFSE